MLCLHGSPWEMESSSSWIMVHLHKGLRFLEAAWLCLASYDFCSAPVGMETKRLQCEKRITEDGWFPSQMSCLISTPLTQGYFLSLGLAAIVVWLGMLGEARAGSGNHVKLQRMLWS